MGPRLSTGKRLTLKAATMHTLGDMSLFEMNIALKLQQSEDCYAHGESRLMHDGSSKQSIAL